MRKLTNLTLMTIAMFCLEHPAAAQLQGAPIAHQFQSDFDAQIRHYQLKSRRQKTLAWVLLGGGFGVSMLAPAIANDNTGTSNDAGGTEVLAAISSGAVIASIPLFFASSANRDRAQMIFFQKHLYLAANDSIRRIYLDEAVNYFNRKGSSNKVAAVVLSIAGGAFIAGGLAISSRNDAGTVGRFIDDGFKVAMISSGIATGVLSIPFYIRAASHRRTVNSILRNGRIPTPDLTISPTISAGANYLAFGIRADF